MHGNDCLVAKVWWTCHLMRNQSIITDLFQGQYRSQLQCPNCQYKSTIFDEYTTI